MSGMVLGAAAWAQHTALKAPMAGENCFLSEIGSRSGNRWSVDLPCLPTLHQVLAYRNRKDFITSNHTVFI